MKPLPMENLTDCYGVLTLCKPPILFQGGVIMEHEECHLIKGLINAVLIEGFIIMVLIGIGNILSYL